MLTVQELAVAMRVHPATVRRWGKAGRIAFVRTPGGRLRVSDDEVRRLLQEAPPP